MMPQGGASDAIQNAIASARRGLALDTGEPARVWEVTRLRPGAPRYLLVVFGTPELCSGLATVDPATGDVLLRASLPARVPHDVMDPDEAVRRAGFRAGSQTELVWDATPASRSPFYPLWRVRDAGHEVWVDAIRGVVWETLDPEPLRGGGSDGAR